MYVDIILYRILFTYIMKVPKYLPKRVYIELNKMFKVYRSNFKLYNFDCAALFASLFPCLPMWLEIQQKLIILPIITVQYSQDVWMINIRTMKRL